MYEAQGLANTIRDLLTERHIGDNGANYRITVTDMAGNVAEIWWEDDQWAFDDGFDRAMFQQRTRQRTQ